MSKKKTGLLIAVGAVLGAAAAGVTYYLKYKSFNDELDKDFHDYEENTEEPVNDEPVSCSDTERTYITLDSNKSKSHEEEDSDSSAATVQEDTEGVNE